MRFSLSRQNSIAAFLAMPFFLLSNATLAGALEDYVYQPDLHYHRKLTEQTEKDWSILTHLKRVSQHWRHLYFKTREFGLVKLATPD